MSRTSFNLKSFAATLACGLALSVGAPAVAPQLAFTTAAQAQEPSQFQSILANYGSFQSHTRYGEIWIPSQQTVPQGWHPYPACNWVHDKDLGWYFNDKTEWGKITHHYGRWAHDAALGWVWVKGDQFSPGWVVWRTSDKWVGWAPMPPEQDLKEISSAAFNTDKHWLFMDAKKFSNTCAGGDIAVAAPAALYPTILTQTRVVTKIRFVRGIAIFVLPPPLIINVVDIDIGVFAPWDPCFFGAWFWNWNWFVTNIVININLPGQCTPPPSLPIAPALTPISTPPPPRKPPPPPSNDQPRPPRPSDDRPSYPQRPTPSQVPGDSYVPGPFVPPVYNPPYRPPYQPPVIIIPPRPTPIDCRQLPTGCYIPPPVKPNPKPPCIGDSCPGYPGNTPGRPNSGGTPNDKPPGTTGPQRPRLPIPPVTDNRRPGAGNTTIPPGADTRRPSPTVPVIRPVGPRGPVLTENSRRPDGARLKPRPITVSDNARPANTRPQSPRSERPAASSRPRIRDVAPRAVSTPRASSNSSSRQQSSPRQQVARPAARPSSSGGGRSSSQKPR